MSRMAVARNYADTLLALADRTGEAEKWLSILDETSSLYRDVPAFRAFLETPRVSLADKREVIRRVFGDRYPETFVRFLLVVMEKRRQSLLPEIEVAARELLNERTGRVHASVTMTVDPDPDLKAEIEAAPTIQNVVVQGMLLYRPPRSEPLILPTRYNTAPMVINNKPLKITSLKACATAPFNASAVPIPIPQTMNPTWLIMLYANTLRRSFSITA